MKIRVRRASFIHAAVVALSAMAAPLPQAVAQEQDDELDFLLQDEQKPEPTEAPEDEAEASSGAAAQPDSEQNSGAAPEAGREVSAPPPAVSEDKDPDSLETIPVGKEELKPIPKPERRGPVVEEIVVTAQKREQSIQDVPISMSVINDQFIAEQGITDIRDVLLFAPNVKLQATTFFATPRCRGFGINNLNRAFELPCGIALDGVPYTQSAYFQGALFDVERVEVLRGPQGTTFGKNTTAGLIHVVSKGPTDELTGHVDVQGGEIDHRRLEAAIGGSVLPEVLNFRVAAISDTRDGYVENTTSRVVPGAAKRPLEREREGFRAKLDFPDLFGSSLKLSFESVDLASSGVGFELFRVKPEVASYLREFDPQADFEKDNLINSEDHPSETFIEMDRVQADWSYDLFGWGIDAVAAHSVLNMELELDLDNGPAPALVLSGDDVAPTTTFELRALSPNFEGLFGLKSLFGWGLGQSDVLAGIFYQRRKLIDSELFIRINDDIFLELTARGDPNVNTGTGFPPIATGTPAGSGTVEEWQSIFNQDAETIAGFAQFQWHLTEEWMLQYGMRLSKETKDGDWDTKCLTPSCPLLSAGGFRDLTTKKSLSESQFQPKVALSYKPLDDVSLFAHWARGFRGGGFNALASIEEDDPTVAIPVPLSFEAEVATEWGIDAKMRLLGGAARLNVSLYRLDIDDFQNFTNVRDPTTQLPLSVVVNAGKIRAQGIEVDLTYLPTDWLTVIGTVGLNDTEFLNFPFGACFFDRPNTDGDDDPRCDQSGKPLPLAPRWNNTLSTNVRYPLAGLFGSGALGGVDLMAGFTLEFISSQFQNDVGAIDERQRQPSFFRIRANVGFGNAARGWSFRVTGENLTDKRTSYSQGTNSGNSFTRGPEPPRLVFGQFRWDF